MPSGIELYNESDGSLLVSSVLMSYNYRSKGTGTTRSEKIGNTTPSSILITLPAGLTLPLIAISMPGYGVAFYGFWGSDRSTYAYGTSAPVGTSYEYWVFDRAATKDSGKNYGLQLVNENTGEITFDMHVPPMRGLEVLSESGPYTSATYANRKLAICQGAFAAHSTPGDREKIRGGQVVIDDGDNRNGDQFRWRIDGKLHGGLIAANGQSATITNVSYDDVLVGPQADPTSPPTWSCPLNCLFVVDVTGYT